mgnify:CR=1 FL=1
MIRTTDVLAWVTVATLLASPPTSPMSKVFPACVAAVILPVAVSVTIGVKVAVTPGVNRFAKFLALVDAFQGPFFSFKI